MTGIIWEISSPEFEKINSNCKQLHVFFKNCCSFAAETAQTGKMAWRIMTHAKATTNTRNRLTKSLSGNCFWASCWCPGSHQHLNRDPDVLIHVHCVHKGRAGCFPSSVFFFLGGGGLTAAGKGWDFLGYIESNVQNMNIPIIYQ